MPREPNERTILAGIAVLGLVWGSTWLVIREGLSELPPFTSLVARLAVAGTVFALLAPRLRRVEGGASPGLALSLVHGLVMLAVPYGIIYWVETRLSSGMTSVLWSVYPLLLGLCAHAFLPSERLSPRRWLGLGLGVLGVASMFLTDLRAAGGESMGAGLVLLASPAVSALGTTYLKRRGGGTSSALLNRNGMAIAALALLPVAWFAERDAPRVLGARAVGSVLYLALVGTVLAFGLYFWLLRHAPATRLGLIAILTPSVAVALGAAFAGERIGLATLLGMACVVSGVALFVRTKPAASAASQRRA